MGFGIRQNSYTLFRSTQAVSSKTPPKNWGLFSIDMLTHSVIILFFNGLPPFLWKIKSQYWPETPESKWKTLKLLLILNLPHSGRQ